MKKIVQSQSTALTHGNKISPIQIISAPSEQNENVVEVDGRWISYFLKITMMRQDFALPNELPTQDIIVARDCRRNELS